MTVVEADVRIMLTAQHAEVVVVATSGFPLQQHGRLFRRRCQRGDTIAILEAVALVALVYLRHSVCGAVLLDSDNR